MLRIWDLNPDHALDRICRLTRQTVDAQLAARYPGRDLPSACPR
ncbi:hypothetical protein [Nocardia heshunensis]